MNPVRVFDGVVPYRAWRDESIRQGQSVGFVPTMGALHEGHLSLVDASLAENDMTIVSVFVNPAQFAPHEDLADYPRTLDSDLAQLHAREAKAKTRGRLAVLIPTVKDVYPHGFTQEVAQQVGAFVEVKGLSHQMEGQTRPTFFRGVATVVTKLFNIVMPDKAYFGQKDIQQAIVIRRLTDDLLFRYPHGAHNVRVLPTARDPADHVALSSRNAYLNAQGRAAAPLLYKALSAGKQTWEALLADPSVSTAARVRTTLDTATRVVELGNATLTAQSDTAHASVALDYLLLNDPSTLAPLDQDSFSARSAILSGALWIRNDASDKQPCTRIIDNLLLGFELG
ncbi:pantoate--beta-alanine ligase (AMP-forming) [Malassezia vespertilionis]|uniref:Pantoate--beta-alanine ligase n=1 Tax=Malassezia vespertilionis TaxID=2020962 RepID=A0A2N1J905_9BASI|nr:pantoate--beta-alanine ligase (AMP-forming) [Malassezia vespertilionis]PKI83028.1 Pan6p [Malassezia vespertilionis]WFD07803.1 pantoate--beta-alanine ligase (AMP-forming) [Malassezia vespertilionis]